MNLTGFDLHNCPTVTLHILIQVFETFLFPIACFKEVFIIILWEGGLANGETFCTPHDQGQLFFASPGKKTKTFLPPSPPTPLIAIRGKDTNLTTVNKMPAQLFNWAALGACPV